ncbi:uncharacterized protein LOC135500904 isoform X2 [Lineus longissimus]|uniref:uncharacterized protein LOC135500904 isoform X2 n=1 Tax=Lineus longissimus TaxID=88925 RepID=UPI002B4F86EE
MSGCCWKYFGSRHSSDRIMSGNTAGVRVHVCSYNVGGHCPSDDLDSWLGLGGPEADLPTVVAVGLQEMSEKNDWSVELLKVFHKRNYVRVKMRTLGWLLLVVFVKRDNLKDIGNVESERTRTGFGYVGGLTANKGAVSIRMDLFGADIIFVNSHFAAHMDSTEDKLEDYHSILKAQTFRDEDVDYLLEHDYVFWMGDLNFRLDTLSKEDVELKITEGDLKSLWPHDQLNKAREKNLIFHDFEEGPLNFPPTYKFDRKTDLYDTSSKKRKPAWCDRILWKVLKNSPKGTAFSARQLSYHSHPQYQQSDHKPVSGLFEIQLLIEAPLLPVQFHPIKSWSQEEQASAFYKYVSQLEVTKNDWIGIFKHDFRHFGDYECRKYVAGNKERIKQGNQLQIVFNDSRVDQLDGKYILAYFSKKKNCLMGYSNVFEVQPRQKKPEPSPTPRKKYEKISKDMEDYRVLAEKGLVPIRVRICTWNVSFQGPPNDMNDWLGLDQDTLPGVVAIGLQEMEDRHVWADGLLDVFSEKDYVLVKSRDLMWLLLHVYVHRSCLQGVTNVESERTKTGFGGLMANKGGVSVRMDLCGIDTIFVNSHFEAHLDNVNMRIDDYKDIIKDMTFRDPDTDRLLDHIYVFWMGDLNFRIDTFDKAEIERRITRGEYESLLPFDQLNKAREQNAIFDGFNEGAISFPPTYKFDPGSNLYDTSVKQRKPAWCDRVLWKVKTDPENLVNFEVKQLLYSSFPCQQMSDHKPVSSELEVLVLKEPPQPPVKFFEVDDCHLGDDLRVEFCYDESEDQIHISSQDWVGLFKAEFSSFDEALIHERASGKDKCKQQHVKFSKQDTETLTPGKFILAYFSKKKNCVVGYSNYFMIKPSGKSRTK